MVSPDDQRPKLDAEILDSEVTGPPADELFRALANSTRRRLLSVLASQSEVKLNDLTDILVGWESTVDGPVGPDEWAQVKIELVHAHLPLLADTGLVDYESGDETVQLESLPTPVEELVVFTGEYENAATATER